MKEGEMAIDDTSLIQAIKQGELSAWAEIIKRYQQPIYYFIARMVKNHQQAADLTQQVFVKAYKRVRQLKDAAQFKPWLYKIALNQCRNYFRIIQRYVFVDVNEANLVDDGSVLDDIIDQETRNCLKQAVDKLPKRQRLTVLFRVYQGLNYKEIADILGCSPDTVKANYHHALNRLKDLMLNRDYS
jgi:RNA polymerase sigma-70 factor (ECF subfamily)